MKRLFYFSLLTSVSIHALLLWVFYLQPVMLRPKSASLFGKNGAAVVIPLSEEDIDLSEKNIALEEVFNKIVFISPQSLDSIASDRKPVQEEAEITLAETPLPPGFSPLEQKPSFSHPVITLPSDLLEEALATESLASPILPQLSYDKNPSPDYIVELQRSALFPNQETACDNISVLEIHYPPALEEDGVKKSLPSKGEINLPSLDIAAPDAIVLVPPEQLLEKAPAFSYQPETSPFLGTPPKGFPKIKASGALPSIDYYGFPQGTPIEWNDEFDIEVCTLPKKEDKGFIFSLTLRPKFDLSKDAMKQNFYFLVDRSNSIERHRFQTFKRAVSRALGSLREGDGFNIIIFDNKVSRLSETALSYSQKTAHLAEEFLEQQKRQNLFSATNIYECLNKLFPPSMKSDEMHTAILITDGDSLLHSEKERNQINAWLEKNDGRVHLHAAAVGQGNNMATLEFLSHISCGQFLYSDTHAAFPRKLAKLVLDLRFPLAKEMTFSVLKGQNITLLPSRLPALFCNRPYTLYGSIDKLSDFVLLLQGKHKDQWLNIKKTISFSGAKQEIRTLEKEWTLQQAHSHYEQYLKEGQLSQLEQAKSLLPSQR